MLQNKETHTHSQWHTTKNIYIAQEPVGYSWSGLDLHLWSAGWLAGGWGLLAGVVYVDLALPLMSLTFLGRLSWADFHGKGRGIEWKQNCTNAFTGLCVSYIC